MTRPGPMPGFHYAGFWVRFLAILIDAIALGIFTSVLLPFWGPQVTVTGTHVTVNAAANGISTLVGLIYFVGLWSWRGQTLGMMPFNMQVVGVADGKKIDVVRGLLRYVGLIISIIPLFLGLIWVAFDARKQGWHDKIAGTVVIRPN
ncbi:MAG: RDD family protein [Chloroflexota bacterium]|nr:RDD family protein [Chloroflexota bacterium]